MAYPTARNYRALLKNANNSGFVLLTLTRSSERVKEFYPCSKVASSYQRPTRFRKLVHRELLRTQHLLPPVFEIEIDSRLDALQRLHSATGAIFRRTWDERPSPIPQLSATKDEALSAKQIADFYEKLSAVINEQILVPKQPIPIWVANSGHL